MQEKNLYETLTRSINRLTKNNDEMFNSQMVKDYFGIFNEFFDINDPSLCTNFDRYVKYLISKKDDFSEAESEIIVNYYAQFIMFKNHQKTNHAFRQIRLVDDPEARLPFVYFDFENKQTCINKKHIELALVGEDKLIMKDNFYHLLLYLTEECYLNNYGKSLESFVEFLDIYDNDYLQKNKKGIEKDYCDIKKIKMGENDGKIKSRKNC